MKLRVQMLLAGAMTLAVPVIGWQSIRQLNDSLIQSRVDAQRLTVANLQLSVAEASADSDIKSVLQLGAVDRSPQELHAVESPGPVVVDGYGDDWAAISRHATHYAAAGGAAMTVRAAERSDRLYLLIDVADDSLVWHRPPPQVVDPGENEAPDPDRFVSNGDAIEILMLRSGTIAHHVLLRAIAPGPVLARAASDTADARGRRQRRGARLANIEASWQQRPRGYRIELSLPFEQSSEEIRLGIVVDDVDLGDRASSWSSFGQTQSVDRRGVLLANAQAIPRLYHANDAAQSVLEQRVAAGSRARLFDSNGRRLADVDRLNQRREDAVGTELFKSFWDALLFRLYAWLVAGDLPLPEWDGISNESLHLDMSNHLIDGETRRYVTPARDRVLGTLAPIGQVTTADGDVKPEAWLWFESNEEHSSAYAGSHLARLFSLLILASLVAGSILFAWGAWLSLRIRRLSRAARVAVAEDGRPSERPLQPSRAHDELGTLSRDLASLLGRSADYNRYLETLSQYLSHELRTPLSVVRTSLENLQDSDLGADSRALLMRAAGGADELGRIISGIVESTRLEQTIEHAETTEIDIGQFVSDCVERYRQVYPNWAISARVSYVLPDGATASSRHVRAAPELLVQALDKLVDNAVEHASEARFDVVVQREPDAGRRPRPMWLLGVANPGDMPDAATAVRPQERQMGRHMGLGLHMVRMIAEAHSGALLIRKRDDGPLVGLTFKGR